MTDVERLTAALEAETRRADAAEARLSQVRRIPAAARSGWSAVALVDARGFTVASLHIEMRVGARADVQVIAEVRHYLSTHVVTGLVPLRAVVIPTTSDLCTIGPSLDVQIIDVPQRIP